MTDSHGAQSKRGRLMDTFNNFAQKASHNHSSNSVPGVTSSTMSSSSSAGGGFPSFRFSPDSEELEEIASTLKATTDERQAESLPESPKLVTTSGGGDTSPIKEYLRKNWASKWDKRSMSLDLDLKGKIITAIEDKKKSVLSHFIPEESSGIFIPSSQSSSSIPEHTGTTVAIGEDHPSPTAERRSLNSNSESVASSRTSLASEVDSKQRGTVNHGNNKISFDNTSKQVNLSSEATAGTGDNVSASSAEENYEEIGLDYLENMTTAGQIDASVLDLLFPSTLPPEQLQDAPLGEPGATQVAPDEHEEDDGEKQPLPSPVESQNVLQISSVPIDMLKSIVINSWTRWVLIPLIAVAWKFGIPDVLLLPELYWFLIGVTCYHIISTSLFFDPHTSYEDYYYSPPGKSDDPVKMGIETSFTDVLREGLNQKYPRSQGWMTELEGDYDPYTYHVRQTKAVFVRMEGPFLYISSPHPKSRISKRRLWSDAPLSTEVTFTKHLAYHLLGSHVFIAPDKLSRRRVWNKKYPIGIQLGQFSVVSTITQVDSNGLKATTEDAPRQGTSTEGDPDSSKYQKGDKEVLREDCSGKTLYLFARTDREKDDWYRRLIGAAKEERPIQFNTGKSDVSNYVLQKLYLECMKKLIPKSSDGKIEKYKEAISLNDRTPTTETATAEKQPSPPVNRKLDGTKPPQEKKGSKGTEEAPSSSTSSKEGTPTENDLEKMFTIPQSPDFLNAFIGRIFFDFLRSAHWTNKVQKLIQKKLNYIRRPPFLEALLVRDIDLGRSAPLIQRASAPFLDTQGLWIDLDIIYDGNLNITLETKLNLMNLRKSSPDTDPALLHAQMFDEPTSRHQRSSMNSGRPNFQDSDADDSGESSDDEEYDPDEFLAQQEITATDIQQSSSEPNIGKPSKKAKILRMAEKFANSHFVTDVKVVKKVIENVANVPLILLVELKSCKGTIALNIPPPPTDRVWIGFRKNPDIQLVVKPKVGSRAVNLTHVTEFIRKFLLHEFQRVMVLPNMDDQTIPLLDFKLPTY